MTKSYVKSFKYRAVQVFYIKKVRKYKVHIDTVYMLKCLLRQKVRSPSLRLLMLHVRVHAWKFHTRCVNDNICYMYSTSFWTFLLTITAVAFLNINEWIFYECIMACLVMLYVIFIKINHIRYRTLHVICDMFNSVHNLKLVF